jgi:hypothetical protein
MRAIIPIAGAALALTACGNNGQAGNTTNVGEGLTAENIVYNDVTAIDAVTGDAANMAADVDVSFTNELGNDLGNAATPSATSSRPAARPRPATETPATNDATANETVNATE